MAACVLSPPFPTRNHRLHLHTLQFNHSQATAKPPHQLKYQSPSLSPFLNCSAFVHPAWEKMRREISMTAVAIFVLLMAMEAKGAETPPAVDCSTLVLGMADCLTFVTNGSTVAKPEGQCCSGLKTVLRTDAQCLCDAFKNSASFGVSLNLTKALALPAACDVTTPSAKNCGVTLSPTTSPAVSPVGAPDSIANSPGGRVGASEVASPAPVPTPGGKNASPVIRVSLGTWVLACLIGAIFF